MYLFIFPAKDLRDDLEVLKSKSHDISEEKNLAQKIKDVLLKSCIRHYSENYCYINNIEDNLVH